MKNNRQYYIIKIKIQNAKIINFHPAFTSTDSIFSKQKKPLNSSNFQWLSVFVFSLAESEGFEPPDPCGSTVFKTAAFDHSASSPLQKYKYF